MKELIIKNSILRPVGNSYGFLIKKDYVDRLKLLNPLGRYDIKIILSVPLPPEKINSYTPNSKDYPGVNNKEVKKNE